MESVPPARAFVPSPVRGRAFSAERTIRGTDVTPDGRLRFDALARYLQAVAEDDLADARWREPLDWWVRRCDVTVRGFPRHGDRVQLTTFCSATGPRWAERTTTAAVTGTDVLQARAVWVAIDRGTGQPTPLGDPFWRVYGAGAKGRAVSARLSHPEPPTPAEGRRWPLRASDFDTAGHANNATAWAAVEDVLATLDWLPRHAEVEYHGAMLPGHDPTLVTSDGADGLYAWLHSGGRRLASAHLHR